MGDEELSPADKLKIAANFIAHAPPGQSQRVKETVDTLLETELRIAERQLVVRRLALQKSEKWKASQS